MTSKQVMLTLALLLLGGCSAITGHRGAEPLVSPYGERRLWAVAPLRNESGSQYADGVRMAEHLARQLEEASDLDVLPVERALRAMHTLQMAEVATPHDARQLLAVLNADALVVGSISAYDPYDPPKLGLAVELYLSPRFEADLDELDVRRLSRAPTDELSLPRQRSNRRQPATVISTILDASDPGTRRSMERYAYRRGGGSDPDSSVRYRISMDLYSEFASYVIGWRLLRAEAQRIAPLLADAQTQSQTAP